MAVEIQKTLCGDRNAENLIESACCHQYLIESTCFYLKFSRVHIFKFWSSPHVLRGRPFEFNNRVLLRVSLPSVCLRNRRDAAGSRQVTQTNA